MFTSKFFFIIFLPILLLVVEFSSNTMQEPKKNPNANIFTKLALSINKLY